MWNIHVKLYEIWRGGGALMMHHQGFALDPQVAPLTPRQNCSPHPQSLYQALFVFCKLCSLHTAKPV